MNSPLKRLANIPSWIVYILLFLTIAIPLIKPLGLPMAISKETQMAYDYIAKLEPGSRVLISFDYSLSYKPEMGAEATVVLQHLLDVGAKVYAIGCTEEGPMLAREVLQLVYGDAGKVYGEDYVLLGFFPGGESGLAALLENLRAVFPNEFNGKPVDELPMMAGVNSIADLSLCISVNGGSTASTIHWVRQVNTAYGQPLIMGVSTVMGPTDIAYLHAGQLVGFLAGSRSAAEYELLLKRPGPAVAALDAQSISHVLILVLILLGNIAYFATRGERRGKA